MVKSNNAVTIQDVAAMAGVSHSTVGRVIGNYGSVSEKTRTRVLQAIEQLKYSPNAVAQSLRNKKTNTLAVVVGSIANNFFSKVISIIENEAASHGYSLIICSTHEDIQTEAHQLQCMQSRRVDAIILASMRDEVPAAEMGLYQSDIPMICIDREIPNVRCDLIQTANFQGTLEATEYLIGLGHRRIGVLATSQFQTVRQRLEGYQAALERHGVPYDPNLVVDRRFPGDNAGGEMVKELLMLNEDVTALLLLNNNLCESVLLTLRDMKKAIPEALSLITWDDTPMNDLLQITAIAQFPELIGKAAAKQAIKRIQENEECIHPKQELFIKTLDTELRIRGSCRKI